MVMQQRLGVTVRLRTAFEDQVAGRFEGDTLVRIVAHTLVQGIGGILIVNDRGHAQQRGPHLVLITDAVRAPVCDVLTGYPRQKVFEVRLTVGSSSFSTKS